MAKGQVRGNKESKKPKKEKTVTAPVSPFLSQMKAAEAGLPPKGLDRSPPEDNIALDDSGMTASGLSARSVNVEFCGSAKSA